MSFFCIDQNPLWAVQNTKLYLVLCRKNGIETLREIRSDADLGTLPVVVLTTSEAEADIIRSYDLGVNWFLTKPATLDSLSEMVKFLANHWQAIADHSASPDRL